MVYRQDNRPKKHRGRYTILGIILGVGLAFVGLYVFDNYKQPIMDNVNQIKNTAISEIHKSNNVIQTSSPQTSNSPVIQQDNQKIQQHNQLIQEQQPVNTMSDQQTSIDSTILEHQIHDQVNNAREQAGLKPLVYDEKVANVAREHSKDMAINNYFDHTSSNGKTVQNRFYEARLPCNPGENIEQAVVGDTSDSIVQSWMNSSGHRANILGYFMSEGIGVYVQDGSIFITDDFC